MRESVLKVLNMIRPALAADGGDVELVRVNAKGKRVYLRFVGACSHCAISDITLKALVERELRVRMPDLTVIAV